MYQLFFVVSYWIGCPGSPGNLSETALIILSAPPVVFTFSIALVLLETASLKVFASLIWSAFRPVLITKYFWSSSIPSGIVPSSDRILTVSPSANSWDPVNPKIDPVDSVILFAVPAIFLATNEIFWLVAVALPSITIFAVWVTLLTSNFNWSATLEPILNWSIIWVGGTSSSLYPKVYNLSELPVPTVCDVVRPTSKGTQKLDSSSLTTFFGGMIWVI